ncbi:mu-type opioid receptor-like [Protopterus annectens]|uniref:mu-type opioid receptor-like n=1 Tax=Protopterus annectens TaxID=7888 RepID=UPI001CFB5A7D|nr:mu-type opioid receptor-like [Protopterus annectens]
MRKWKMVSTGLGRAVSCLLTIPISFSAKAVTISYLQITVCIIEFPKPTWWWIAMWKWCMFGIAYFLPACVLITCCSLLVWKLKTANRRVLFTRLPIGYVTKRVVSFACAFLICWTPLYLLLFLDLTLHFTPDYYLEIIRRLFLVLATSNSCINPVLYAFVDKHFQQHCKTLFSCVFE